MSITERIKSNYRRGITYHELMRAVFPRDVYPKAWMYQSNGGPPGCAMAFGKALNQLGLVRIDNVICKTDRCEF